MADKRTLDSINSADSISAAWDVSARKGYLKRQFIDRILELSPYIDSKTVRRWLQCENKPRESNFSVIQMKTLLNQILKDIYANDRSALLAAYLETLSRTFYVHELENISNPQEQFNRLFSLLTDTAFRDQKNRTILSPVGMEESSPEPPTYINANPNTIFEEVSLSIHVPVLPFPVKYYLRHVQNGKNQFLPEWDRLPLNQDYEFEKTDSENTYTVRIPSATPSIGFQFKCFAVCEERYAAILAEELKSHFNYASAIFNKHLDESNEHYHDEKGIFPLVDISRINSKRIWFLLPNFHTYITFDPYINNYYSKP